MSPDMCGYAMEDVANAMLFPLSCELVRNEHTIM